VFVLALFGKILKNVSNKWKGSTYYMLQQIVINVEGSNPGVFQGSNVIKLLYP